MYKQTALTNVDSYKTCHAEMFPEGTTKVYSNFTPRSMRHFNAPNDNKIVWFGLQAFLQELKELWDETFFKKPKGWVAGEFATFVAPFAGPKGFNVERLWELHDIGYLPLEIKALPEGSRVNVGVPCLTITNTDPKCFWLPNFLETWISSEMWKSSTSATTSYAYREIIEKYAEITGGNKDFIAWQGHDFSVRGMSGIQDAAKSGAGHLLSFTGSDNFPAVNFINQVYKGKETFVAGSVPACYDEFTEVLTSEGFKLFSELSKADLVAQYHESGKVDFVVPSEWYDMHYSGEMISFTKPKYRYVDIMVTPNHKMVRYNLTSEKVELFEAGSTEYRYRSGYSDKNKLIVAGYGSGEKSKLTPIERLKIAFQADGSYASNNGRYTGERSGCLPIRFSLKKERKRNVWNRY